MIKTLQRAAVVTAALFALSPAVAGVAHADPFDPPLPGPIDFEYPCPETGCVPAPDPDPDPPVFELNCPPLCLDDPELTYPPQFPCPPYCIDPGDPDDGDGDDPGQDPDGDDGDDGDDPGDGDQPDDGDDPGDEPDDGDQPDDGDDPGDDGDEPSDDPTPTPDDGGDQPNGSRLPKAGGPDLPLLLASGIGLIAAGALGYLLVARRY